MNHNGIQPVSGGILTNRYLEWFHHTSLPEWGYSEVQTDTFAILHPAQESAGETYPLYVVFHSAGHDVYSTIGCTWLEGNHDIYRAPDNMFALYLDCRQHMNDWWWGGNYSTQEVIDEKRGGVEKQPVENRVIATIEWVFEHYPIDRERVYAVGNSMGGSGALGIALCRGDIFAAIKANVPAGVRHAADRCCLDTQAPEGFQLPDPPVLIDYSGQDDFWSNDHSILYRSMREKKYAIIGFWGKFGHANNNHAIYEVNDLIHSFDIASVRRNEAYPVFTSASTDDIIPWADDGSIVSEEAGQVNAYFRWGKATEESNQVSIPLRLLSPDEWTSRVTFPEQAIADVTLRRLQTCKFTPGMRVAWEFGTQSGSVTADENGLVTVPKLVIDIHEKPLLLRALTE